MIVDAVPQNLDLSKRAELDEAQVDLLLGEEEDDISCGGQVNIISRQDIGRKQQAAAASSESSDGDGDESDHEDGDGAGEILLTKCSNAEEVQQRNNKRQCCRRSRRKLVLPHEVCLIIICIVRVSLSQSVLNKIVLCVL